MRVLLWVYFRDSIAWILILHNLQLGELLSILQEYNVVVRSQNLTSLVTSPILSPSQWKENADDFFTHFQL